MGQNEEMANTSPRPDRPDALSTLSLPGSWGIATIDVVGQVCLGRQLSPKYREGTNPTPYIRAANITVDGLALDDVQAMDFDEIELEKYSLHNGDVLLAEASGSAKHVGRSAIWRSQIQTCCFQNTVIRFRSKWVRPEFSALVFRYYLDTGEFARIARGVGILHLGAARFSKMGFPVPSLAEQDAIGNRTKLLFGKLERAEKGVLNAINNLHSQYAIAVSEHLRLPNIYPHVYSSNSETTIHADPAPTSAIGDVCVVTNGRAFKTSEWSTNGTPIVRIQNLKDPALPFNYFQGALEDHFKIKRGDLLFAWSGTPETSFGAHLWEGEDAALNQHIFRIRPNPTLVDKEYLYHSLRGLHKLFVGLARGGGGLAHLSKADFLATKLWLPSIAVQQEVVANINSIFEQYRKSRGLLEDTVTRITRLRQEILVRALSGKLVRGKAAASTGLQLLDKIRREPPLTVVRRSRSTQQELFPARRVSTQEGRRPLWDVLSQSGSLKAQQLMIAAGYRLDSADDLSAFYSDLSRDLRNGKIRKTTAADRTKLLEAVPL
jgi:type I restriction enzyme, S subunit